MIKAGTEIETDLVLRVDEDGPCWRWAWLDDHFAVVSEGVGLTEAGAENAAATVLEVLATLTERSAPCFESVRQIAVGAGVDCR